jgi:hypothetical protein
VHLFALLQEALYEKTREDFLWVSGVIFDICGLNLLITAVVETGRSCVGVSVIAILKMVSISS